MIDKRQDTKAWASINDKARDGVIISPLCPLLNQERNARVTSLRFGDPILIHAIDRNWVLISGTHDHYLGWTNRGHIKETFAAADAPRVTEKFSLVFAEANIKSKVSATLPMGARIEIDDREGDFVALAHVAGYLWKSHIAPKALQPYEWAMQCLGAPYLWGGGAADGIDCSGLSQLAFAMVGKDIPRDSDQQEAALAEVTQADLRANDLVFWKGHVGIMISESEIIHATAFAMKTIIEPLARTTARVGNPTSFRRVLE